MDSHREACLVAWHLLGGHGPIWLVLDLVDERGPLEAGERAGDGLLHPVDVLLSVHL